MQKRSFMSSSLDIEYSPKPASLVTGNAPQSARDCAKCSRNPARCKYIQHGITAFERKPTGRAADALTALRVRAGVAALRAKEARETGATAASPLVLLRSTEVEAARSTGAAVNAMADILAPKSLS